MDRGLYSGIPSISDNGRFVAFESPAPDLVKGDRNEATSTSSCTTESGARRRSSASVPKEPRETPKARSPRSPPTTGVSSPSRLWPRAWSRATALTRPTPSSAVRCAPLGGLDRSLPKAPLGRRPSFPRQTGRTTDEVQAPGVGAPASALALAAVPASAGVAVTTTRVSVNSAGASGNPCSGCSSNLPISISATGRFVAFSDNAPNLVKDKRSYFYDVYVRDRVRGETTRVSVNSAGAEGNDDSFFPSISANGRFVAFASLASNLVPGRHKPSPRCLRPRPKAGQDDPGRRQLRRRGGR